MNKRYSKILGVAVTLAMLSSLIIAPFASAVSSPTVSQTSAVISSNSIYTLTLNITTAILPGTITVTFPTGTTFTAGMANTDLTLGTTGGIGQPVLAIAAPAAIAFPTTNSITITPQGNIGAGAVVQIVIGNVGTAKYVVNTATPGDYTLTVATSAETTAVASASFTLTVPSIPAVAGVVQGFNAAGVKLDERTGNLAISGALAVAGVVRVVVGPGTYDEGATLAIPAGKTVVSSAGAATTLISDANASVTGGDVTITGTLVAGVATPSVLDGFTVTRGVTSTGQVTIQNCVISNAAGTALAFGALAANTTALLPAKSIGNTISASPGAVAGNSGMTVAAAEFVTSTNDVLNIAAVTVAAPVAGTAITNAATGTVTVTSATITGASGTGLANAGTATVAGSTFSTLATAINVAAGSTTTVGTSTINACGFSSATAPLPAIMVAGAPTNLSIGSSTISNSPSNILATAAAAGVGVNTFVNFNTLTGNVLSFDNNDTTAANYIDASNNWWGVSTGPAVASTGSVYTTPFLASQVSNQMLATAVAVSTTTLWQTTAGVDIITGTTLPVSTIAAAKYGTNPAGTVVPANVDVTTYFDVYRRGGPAVLATDSVTVRFYGIKSNAATVYAFSNTQGIWVLASGQAVDQFRGCVTVTITPTSTPNVSNLTGLAFALVEPAAVVLPPVAPAVLTPVFGDMEAAIQPTFTWTASATATSYEFVLAEEIGQDNKFAIIDYSASTSINGHVSREQLKWGTVYNWRVRAISAAGASAWTEGFFTTISEPVPAPEPVPPVIIEPTPPAPAPEIILQIPPTEAPVNVIPPYLLWTVIAVGAVLIIAVVVLIVRTRRVA